MPVDVTRITTERLESWRKQLIDAHATPVILLGVGHDHVTGQINVITTKGMTPAQIRIFLKHVLKEFDELNG